MLTGVVVKPLKRLPDERGSFTEIMRVDWKEIAPEDSFSQSNFSVTYPGIVRAWHRHLRGQNDYFLAINGAVKIGIYDEKTQELDEIISTGKDLQVVRVPGHYWHGFKAVGNEQAMLIYFTTRLYDRENPDEERLAWDDSKVVPKLINGKTEDPRVGKPWDWNQLPNK